MHLLLAGLVLTVSQAVLVTALPRPQVGQSAEWVEMVAQDCDLDTPLLTPTLTRTLVRAQPDPTASREPDGNNAASQETTTVPFGVPSETVTTLTNPDFSISTVTLTAIPSEQSPTVTDASQPYPDTTGSVNATLNTSGRPSSQPFPTELPTITESTLQPLNTTAPFNNATNLQSTITQTITIPLTTVETVIVTSTVTSVPVPTNVTITQVTFINTTVTINGSTVATSAAGTTVLVTQGTALSETTLLATTTITGTVSTTLVANGTLAGLPTPITSCNFKMGCSGQDLFQPIGMSEPPANIGRRAGHPAPRLGINNATGPLQTNKFYANFFLGSQGSPAFAVPYSLTWSKGSGNAQSWGLAVSHIEASQRVFGPTNDRIPGNPNSYFINPLGIQSIVLSAAELGSGTVLTSDNLLEFSANINLQPSAGSTSSITFPVVQGMGMVTGIYTSLQPAIQSSVFFRAVSSAGNPKNNVYKYRLTLEDGNVWLLYATPSNGLPPNFQLISSTLLQGVAGWSGMVQVAKVPDPSQESIYDGASGLFVREGTVAGFANGNTAEYSISWTKGGQYADNGTLVMYALPHHVASFAAGTRGEVTTMTLQTPTKGIATAVISNCWVMEEVNLPIQMGFSPWRADGSNITALSAQAKAAIQAVAPIEASQDMGAQSNLNSMYFSGKALSKFATIVYTMNDLADQKPLAAAALANLKAAFATFVENRQQFPLFYDTDWKGIVSSATYVTGDPGVDFGNSFYNDHHFHYGYFVHAAAVIGYLDPSWLVANKDYVNALVRDAANPSRLDQFFPVFRAFDWYNGHSWAKGLFESGDGKDQESTSEDAMFAYALKMWGKTVGDASMEARGNLMLSVLRRSLRSYFLMDSGNTNQPRSYIDNKVTGILFENKIDHTTYFGSNFEYIQGIHMLPLLPFSAFIRDQNFVVEEWNAYFRDGGPAQASSVVGGWKGVLYSNLGLINPVASYNFFTQPSFDPSWLDGGASRTWYIAYAAGLGGSP